MISLPSVVLPPFARWAAIAVAMGAMYALGSIHEARVAGEKHLDYVEKQAATEIKIVQAQAKTVLQTETLFRDRIQTIYKQGATIEILIPQYVSPDDTARFGVNAGFVRLLDAAWEGEAVGPASDSDREPAGLAIDAVAETTVGNATSCRAWREQALGWRQFYADQQRALNDIQ